MNKRHPEEKSDGPFEIAGLVLVAVILLVGMIWFFASNRIVHSWTPPLRWLGQGWALLPFGAGDAVAAAVRQEALVMLRQPGQVSFLQWIGFVNKAFAPGSLLLTGAVLAWFLSTLASPAGQVRRRFKSADDLLRAMSHVFTGTAPILHIRKAIVQNKDPLWARQTRPEEVLLNWRYKGKKLIANNEVKRDGLEDYFTQLYEPYKSANDVPAYRRDIAKRPLMHSRMLGYQIVNMAADAPLLHSVHEGSVKPGAILFADRFSSVGKVLFGMFVAKAFGGEAGAADYGKARDQLNNASRGRPSGMPNLEVAQWIFDKYRAHPIAARLFAVHHWEYTCLVELLVQAKRRGKAGHWEFMWLKPMNRVLFYVLNASLPPFGRYTPHTESAAVFYMHAFEVGCAQRKRLPLKIKNGELVHNVTVKGAIEGMELEWERYRDGLDEHNDIFSSDEVNGALMSALRSVNLEQLQSPPPEMVETPFDARMSQAAQAAEARKANEEDVSFASVLGSMSGTSR